MQSDEILLIFKTVRLLANFPNVIYILAFDRKKVADTLKTKDEQINAHEYIKKIIQIEKQLPEVTKSYLKDKFLKGIEDIIGNKSLYKENELELLYDFGLKDTYIKNIRDLNRFFNAFSFSLQAFKEESICIEDLIAITAIESFNPELYLFIRNNQYVFCSKYVSDFNNLQIINLDTTYTNLNNFASKLLELNNTNQNINILSLIFFPLFNAMKNIKIKDEDNKEEEKTKTLKDLIETDKLIKLQKEYNIESENQQDELERICNPQYFEAYFSCKLPDYLLNEEEKTNIKNTIKDSSDFIKTLMSLFNKKPEKILHFINYINQPDNPEFKTKENTLYLLKNFLSLSDEERELTKLLENNNFFFNISRHYISNFKTESGEIVLSDEISTLIQDTVSNINSNLYFFIYLIFCVFKFPINEPPSLSEGDEENLNEIAKLIKTNLDTNKLHKNSKAMQILEYLQKYLNCSDFVRTYINEVLQEGKEEYLLDLLMTSEHQNYHDYGFAKAFFDQNNKLEDLKNKLLDIKYKEDFKDLRIKSKYDISQGHTSQDKIVDEVLSYIIEPLRNDLQIKESEEFLKVLSEEFEALNENELKFSIELGKHQIENIKAKLKDIKENNPELLYTYKIEKSKISLILD